MERVVTLNCVSNEVGGPYIGTARWLGVPLAPLLREVGVRQGADQLLARSVEGMTIGAPMAALLDGQVEHRDGQQLLVRYEDAAALNARLVGAGLRVSAIGVHQRTLEEIVLAVTGTGSDQIS